MARLLGSQSDSTALKRAFSVELKSNQAWMGKTKKVRKMKSSDECIIENRKKRFTLFYASEIVHKDPHGQLYAAKHASLLLSF
jgi:hypothetical protein